MKGIFGKAFMVTLLISQLSVLAMDQAAQAVVEQVAPVATQVAVEQIAPVAAQVVAEQIVPVVAEQIAPVVVETTGKALLGEYINTVKNAGFKAVDKLAATPAAKMAAQGANWTIKSMKAYPEFWVAGIYVGFVAAAVAHAKYKQHQRRAAYRRNAENS
ncbi:hypothetical protein CVU75_03125 [Candidatus Dependentiae bacterium HGW-Dependentiae-1]|nr:MAG: hypothetical protein CVU75_03125 [Candidatus Dependentiae bacterium HGW-Dependentiae-1]